MTTKTWANSLDVPNADVLEPIAEYSAPSTRSPDVIVRRAIILHGLVAVAYGVDSEPVVLWLKENRLWDDLTPRERVFILNPARTEQDEIFFKWRQEAEWTLLWIVGKVDLLGLPTATCDTRLLVDVVMPKLGEDVNIFIEGSTIRTPGAVLAEDDRTYDLWCHVMSARRKGLELPSDLQLGVLYQRRFVFEWINGEESWDEVTCDA